jgi:hypothetical protein
MAQQTINIGTAPNDGTGTPLRTAFDYCNLNFTELYTAVGPSGNNIVVPGTATITGDLTVRTTGLIVNATGTGVQVSPSAPLCVKTRNSDSVGLRVLQSTGGTAGIQFTDDPVTADWGSILATSANLFLRSNSLLQFQTGGATERLAISSTGVCTWSNVGGVAGTAMTLNSTGLGVGVSPSYRIDAQSPSGASTVLRLKNNTATDNVAIRFAGNQSNADLYLIGTNVGSNGTGANFQFYDIVAAATRMTIDSSGNLILQSSATPATLTTNGQLTVNATSNTNLRFSYRGSDGTTRVANITLA